jgi:hypothetical protein
VVSASFTILHASSAPVLQVYGYNVPDNMYLWGSLSRLLKLNQAVWQDDEIDSACIKLLDDIHKGILSYGVVEVEPDVRVYAYEVDGLEGALVDFDDPNLPSLLAMPLLGYELYSKELYSATRQRILSGDTNPFYFNGTDLHGLGSPHTEPEFVWPLATAVDALTTANTSRHLELLKFLPKMAAGNGLVHESVHVDWIGRFSRPEFGWANAMSVVMLEQLLGVDCDLEAEKFRLTSIAEREAKELGELSNHDIDAPKYYEQLEAGIIHVSTNGADGDEHPASWQDVIQDQMQQQAQQELLQKVLALNQQQQGAGKSESEDDEASPPEKPAVAAAGQTQQAAESMEKLQQDAFLRAFAASLAANQ